MIPNWKDKRVFVSGGNGVIGRELARKLIDRGAIVWVGDVKPRGTELPDDVLYRRGDLNELTADEVNAFAPEVFIHLAATFERSTETYGFWEENFRHNVALSHHLMSVTKDCPSLRRVVFASSYLIYDPALYTFDQPVETAYSLRETDPILPRNLTGAAKLSHEIELRFLNGFRSETFSSVSARIYRGYGCNSRDVISRWVRDLLHQKPITVYRPEGRFDYIFAEDTAEGLIRLAEKPELTGIINLGTGRARAVSDVVAVLRTHFPDMQATEADADIPFEGSQADMTLYEQTIGWRPEYTLETAIPKIIAFERARNGEYSVEKKAGGPAGSNILVTSISRKIPLLQAVKKALQTLGGTGKLIGSDLNPDCLGRYFVDEFWAMPRLSEFTSETLLTALQERKIQAVIPTRDGELLFWSQHKPMLSQHGISVMVSDENSVNHCLDKLLFYDVAANQNLPAIFTTDDVNQLPDGPLVVKERYGAGSLNIRLNVTADEARQAFGQFSHPIVQPFITGREYSVDAYVTASGDVKGVVARTRDLVVNGESQVTTTVPDSELEQVSTDIIRALSLYGHVVLQLLKDDAGHWHLIECNSRFGGASTLSIAAGLDSFYWFLLESEGEDLTAAPFIRAEKPLRQVRYPADIVTTW